VAISLVAKPVHYPAAEMTRLPNLVKGGKTNIYLFI